MFFSVNGINYTTFKAIWEIAAYSPDQLSAVCEWPGIPLKQNWYLWLKDGVMKWQVELESPQDISISHIGMVFCFKGVYQKWTGLYENGSMPVLTTLQQRLGVDLKTSLDRVGLIAAGRHADSFPYIGLCLDNGTFLNELLLSSCRDMFSGVVFSSVSVSGSDPLRIYKNSRIILSSGRLCLFEKEEDLTAHITGNTGEKDNA